ncbi:type III pantothenate kinase [Dyadobacter jejuensis]|uniref:Type III pantothenate kinase n=1 Tax=Dyadobacter jejuensis TaxID=1082580 RepID=A0A316ARR8_9BACT|nr:type III pantothenate kinase [Dyadobacter jejuensis]PWJ60056.1 type III pantothenate kinase [Dyadobacter jejuensis]
MLLAVDVGNTDTVFGLYEGSDCISILRLRTGVSEGASHYESQIRMHFMESGLWLGDVGTVVLGSVVPDATPVLSRVLKTLFVDDIIIVGPTIYPDLNIAIDHPHEIGADLIANSVAAMHRHQSNCVVVDFGTALTFTTVSADRQILGVAILPGLKTAVKALFTNTAQLPEVPLVLPQSAIGKNTVHAIQAGILLGYEGLVKSLLTRIRKELNGDCIAIATGGLSSIIETLEDEFVEIDPSLTLDGLRLIGERVGAV